MEIWSDIPQQVWKANVMCWLVYYVALTCSTFYMLRKWKTSTNEAERRLILMDVTFWFFIVPFIITFGFAFVVFSGIGILSVVVDYFGY